MIYFDDDDFEPLDEDKDDLDIANSKDTNDSIPELPARSSIWEDDDDSWISDSDEGAKG